MSQANTSGVSQLPNSIQATQVTEIFTPSQIVCNDDGTILINANTINYAGTFNPPISGGNAAFIVSPDATAKALALNGGTVQITGDLDMQTGFIQNCGNPTASGDVVPLGYLQSNYSNTTQTQQYVGLQIANLSTVYYPQTYTLDQINPPVQNVNMSNKNFTQLANATTSAQAVTLGQANSTFQTQSAMSAYYTSTQSDARYYQNTVPLNSITTATNTINCGSQRLASVADATLATDAMNRQFSDGRYYSNTTKLNAIVVPNGNVDINNNKLINVQNGTSSGDSVNFSQLSATNTALSAFISRFQTGSINLGAWTAGTTYISVTSVSGIITSADKKNAVDLTTDVCAQTVRFNYSLSAVPQIFVTVRYPQTAASPSGAWYSWAQHIVSISTTQCTFNFGNINLTQAAATLTPSLDVLFLLP